MVESHQRSKVDTSGTARAIVQSFQKLGLHFDEVCCMLKIVAIPQPLADPSVRSGAGHECRN